MLQDMLYDNLSQPQTAHWWQITVALECIDAWMRSNRLRMNANKTQLVWLGTRQQLTTTELPLLSALVKLSSAVIDIGVNIDGPLTMADHITALRRSCLFQLREQMFHGTFVTVRKSSCYPSMTPNVSMPADGRGYTTNSNNHGFNYNIITSDEKYIHFLQNEHTCVLVCCCQLFT